jgi:hypothetical protein
MRSSIVSGKARFVACCSILYALAGSSGAVAQAFVSPGCDALQNASPFNLASGQTTGLFPLVTGQIFYQGETIGADWSQTVFMDFQVWLIGDGKTTQDTLLYDSGNTNQGTIRQTLNIPNDYFAVKLTNTDQNDDFSINWACNSDPNPHIPKTHDNNDDGKSDIMFRDTSGNVALWLMNGGSVLSSGGLGAVPSTWSVVGQRDFNGDGKYDLLWRDTSGNTAIWFMNGLTVASTASLGNVPTTWTVKGTGGGEILWQDTAGNLAVWFMNGSQVWRTASLGAVAPSTNWGVVAVDVGGNILWHNTATGAVAVWLVAGTQVTSTVNLGAVPSNWVIQGIGDFNGDGTTDILWWDNASGTVAIWFTNASWQVQSSLAIGVVPASSTWSIVQTGDYNGDGKSDILWKDGSGNLAIWFVNGSAVSSTANLGNVGTSWAVLSQNAE